MKSTIEQLRQAAKSYVPGPESLAALSKTVLVPIIGITAVGKSTRTKHVVTIDPEFGRAVGFTTRPQRPDEAGDVYQFRPHSEKTLLGIADDVQQRKLVQFAVHPANGFVYGSTVEDYSHPYTLIDVAASSVAHIRKIPTKATKEMTLVCDPAVWKNRFILRQADPKDASRRLAEGVSSLEWSLGQKDMVWIDNTQPLQPAYDEIANVARGMREPSAGTRQIGEKLLATLMDMRSS